MEESTKKRSDPGHAASLGLEEQSKTPLDVDVEASTPSIRKRRGQGRSIDSIQRTPNDVLCGRGVPILNYHGNLRLHGIVESYRPQYQNTLRKEKPALIKNIVAQVKQGGARFLKRTNDNDNPWEEMDDDYAYEKVSHALRCRRLSSQSSNASVTGRAAYRPHEQIMASTTQQQNGALPAPTPFPPGVLRTPSDNFPSPTPFRPGVLNSALAFGPSPAGLLDGGWLPREMNHNYLSRIEPSAPSNGMHANNTTAALETLRNQTITPNPFLGALSARGCLSAIDTTQMLFMQEMVRQQVLAAQASPIIPNGAALDPAILSQFLFGATPDGSTGSSFFLGGDAADHPRFP